MPVYVFGHQTFNVSKSRFFIDTPSTIRLRLLSSDVVDCILNLVFMSPCSHTFTADKAHDEHEQHEDKGDSGPYDQHPWHLFLVDVAN